MNKIFTIIILILVSYNGYSQDEDTKKADKHFARLEFVDAAKAYEKLVVSGKGNIYVHRQLAECYYNVFNTIEAERWLARTLQESEEPELVYKYSQILKANMKYEESNNWMKRFAELVPNDIRAKLFLENPDYLPIILGQVKKFHINTIDELNTEYSEFGGTVKNGLLYFVSSRNISRKNYSWNDQPFLDLYSANISEDGDIQNPNLLPNVINTQHHEGLVTFSPDGKTMYFARESFFDNDFVKDPESNDKQGSLKLYSSSLLSDGWSTVTPLPINNLEYSVKNPSLSSDGKTLFFASDMPNGYGGFDIYKVQLNEDGSFGEPVNLGGIVNTASQEMFPFIGDNDVLYFSSDGHLGLGGLDVFFTKETNGKYAPIRNAGTPLNSNADDFAISFTSGSDLGFVSSNRQEGKGSDDLYAIKKTEPICDVMISVRVSDKETGENILGANVGVYDKSGKLISTIISNNEGVSEFRIPCETDIKVSAIMPEYENGSADIPATSAIKKDVTILLSPIENLINDEIISLNPIYFEYNKWNITPKAAFELDQLVSLMEKYPDMVVALTAHTDNIGSSGFNQKLSDKRAKTTAQYVISKGIDKTRISGEGKGENEPKVDCGNNCSDEDNQMNRRSEFVIVSGNPNS